MNAKNSSAERLLSIDELDRDIVNLTGEFSGLINNPSAEGLFTAVETSVVNSPPP